MASDVLFEIQRFGNTAKATAIDAASGLEAVVMGPVSSSDHDLKMLALRKLRYLQAREGASGQAPVTPPRGKGIIV